MNQRSDVPTSAMSPVDIGFGAADDLSQIVEIVNYTAANSIATFATRPTSVAERREWFDQFATTGPYKLLVARQDNQVLGYACSQRYRDHEAFQQTVEASIALHAQSRGRGIGTSLYRALFDSLAGEPVHVTLAGIAMPNDASVALHRKFGFTEVGVFSEYAVKHGQYISSQWMQRLASPQHQS
ncbi:GNAT family N-acetyltransferase [Streptomyces iconiensis]|uniref:GNAT family N-acetyltransferase n=1 Tax=Streptomyces iconiensis TaxID=1384038 RepID=A0ABT7A9V4_9ACTN|nr:GNAT family N-acetyltransferase [Streptomyces iconiensis]MDJ1138105.1 GNAT family N-acetyltransferase [Streptomyces iconiensis]